MKYKLQKYYKIVKTKKTFKVNLERLWISDAFVSLSLVVFEQSKQAEVAMSTYTLRSLYHIIFDKITPLRS